MTGGIASGDWTGGDRRGTRRSLGAWAIGASELATASPAGALGATVLATTGAACATAGSTFPAVPSDVEHAATIRVSGIAHRADRADPRPFMHVMIRAALQVGSVASGRVGSRGRGS